MAASSGLLYGLARQVRCGQDALSQTNGRGFREGYAAGESAHDRPSRFHAAAAADWYYKCSVKRPAMSAHTGYTSNKAQRGSCHSDLSDSLPVMTFLAVLDATAVKIF